MLNLPAPISPPSLQSQPSPALPPSHPLILQGGEKAAWAFFEFFTATISNANTRRAYATAVLNFLNWCQERGVTDLGQIRAPFIAEYIRNYLRLADPSIKLHLSGIRQCFDFLVTRGILDQNPASSVKGPKHIVHKGKTPLLDADQTRELLDSLPLDNIVGLRDRALIGTMVFTFGRIGAVLGMNVGDYFLDGRRQTFRLHEKGGKHHTVPAHHNAIEYVEDYLDAAGLRHFPRAPIFQSAPHHRLSGHRLLEDNARQMIKRRARNAGLPATTCCHTFRATGITNYLENGGTLEKARALAAHQSSQTTRLYDHSDDKLTLDEIERIRI